MHVLPGGMRCLDSDPVRFWAWRLRLWTSVWCHSSWGHILLYFFPKQSSITRFHTKMYTTTLAKMTKIFQASCKLDQIKEKEPQNSKIVIKKQVGVFKLSIRLLVTIMYTKLCQCIQNLYEKTSIKTVPPAFWTIGLHLKVTFSSRGHGCLLVQINKAE